MRFSTECLAPYRALSEVHSALPLLASNAALPIIEIVLLPCICRPAEDKLTQKAVRSANCTGFSDAAGPSAICLVAGLSSRPLEQRSKRKSVHPVDCRYADIKFVLLLV